MSLPETAAAGAVCDDVAVAGLADTEPIDNGPALAGIAALDFLSLEVVRGAGERLRSERLGFVPGAASVTAVDAGIDAAAEF